MGARRPSGRPRDRRAEAQLVERSRAGEGSARSSVRIPWNRTRVVASEEGGRRITCVPVTLALVQAGDGRHTIANKVPRGRLGREAVEAAVREALSGLGGRWTARIAPLDAISVEITSPDGFRWLAFIPNPARQERSAMARRLKDACRRPPTPSGLTRWRRAWILVPEEP